MNNHKAVINNIYDELKERGPGVLNLIGALYNHFHRMSSLPVGFLGTAFLYAETPFVVIPSNSQKKVRFF